MILQLIWSFTNHLSLGWLLEHGAGDWLVTACMWDYEADIATISTICSLSAQHTRKTVGPIPHMSSEVYQNKKILRFEDIQLLL